MRNRTHKWFVEQYNRNRKPSEWVTSFQEIKTNIKNYANRKNQVTKSFN